MQMLWKMSPPWTQRRVAEGSGRESLVVPRAVPGERLVAVRPAVQVGPGAAREGVRGEGLCAPPRAGGEGRQRRVPGPPRQGGRDDGREDAGGTGAPPLRGHHPSVLMAWGNANASGANNL